MMLVFYSVLLIQAFIAGSIERPKNRKFTEWLVYVIQVLFITSVGLLLMLISSVWELCKWIYSTFQVKFFFLYLFTRRFDNAGAERLTKIRAWRFKYKKEVLQGRKPRIADKVWYYCFGLVLRRNELLNN